jgi:hypothetical protein
MVSSDIEICHGAHAGVQCDGEVITIQYVVNDEPVGDVRVYTRTDAVHVGQELARDGYHKDFPVSGISTADVKVFGARLVEYGLKGQ